MKFKDKKVTGKKFNNSLLKTYGKAVGKLVTNAGY